MARDMMLTPDEYMALMRLITSERESEGASEALRNMDASVEQPKKRRRSRTARSADKKLSEAFKEANEKLRLKNGSLRKGKTQGDVARLAHRLRKKMK